jgi:hypothetical protein
MHRFTSLIAIVLWQLSTTLSAAAIIDDFSIGPLALTQLKGQPFTSIVQNGLDPARVIGGKRTVKLNVNGPTPNGGVQLTVDTAIGRFQYQADDGYSAANFSIGYGGATNDLRADLLSDGSNALVLDFDFAQFEQGEGAFDIVLDTASERSYLFVPVGSSTTPFSLVLPFKAFTALSPGDDFGHVVGIEIGTGNGNLRGDFSLDGIRTAFFPDGDYNFDGNVTIADYVVWKSQYGEPFSYYPVNPADGNRNGRIDAADYTIWRNSLEMAENVNGPLDIVPELTSINLCLLAILWVSTAFFRSMPRFP